MASTVWKGFLSFGLISVPIRLFTAARPEKISFRQIHKDCHSRIKQQLHCPVCERTVQRSELVKGYEYAKDQYVIVEDADLKTVQPQSSDAMEILEFVKLDEVDPLYFDSSFYALPEDAGRKAYQLLTKAMEESGYAAIAKISMHQREYTVVIRPRANGLTLHTMYYPAEVRDLAEYGQDAEIEVKPQETQLAAQLIESLAASFEPSKYEDGYQQNVKRLIDAKREGKEAEAAAAPRLAPVIDLMEALQKSLAERPDKKEPKRAGRTDAGRKASQG